MSINYGLNYDCNNNGNVMAGCNKRGHISGSSYSNSKTGFKVRNDIIYCVRGLFIFFLVLSLFS